MLSISSLRGCYYKMASVCGEDTFLSVTHKLLYEIANQDQGWTKIGTVDLLGAILISTANPCVIFRLYHLEQCADIEQAHRKALLDIMTSYIPIERVKFNKRLIKIQQDADKVVLHFADGEVASSSVLAGADGIKSLVRSHVLEHSDPTQADPVYADSYCYRGVIPTSEAEEILGDLTDVAKFYFGYKRSAVTYRISSGRVSQHAFAEDTF